MLQHGKHLSLKHSKRTRKSCYILIPHRHIIPLQGSHTHGTDSIQIIHLYREPTRTSCKRTMAQFALLTLFGQERVSNRRIGSTNPKDPRLTILAGEDCAAVGTVVVEEAVQAGSEDDYIL